MVTDRTHEPIVLPPSPPSPEWCLHLEKALHGASWAGVEELAKVLPHNTLIDLAERTTVILKHEPTLVELSPAAAGHDVVVVGDTHGQFHDVCRMFVTVGHPSNDKVFLFNGDFIDRGAWGVELMALLLAWKLALPSNVFLLRGNHESTTCARLYGFQGEMIAKYGRSASKALFVAFRRLFANLPLAALVQRNTLVLHGGLFRAPPPGTQHKKRRRGVPVSLKCKTLTVGSLEHLRASSKGGQDPDGLGHTLVAADVLWSDPVLRPGMRGNEARGVGTVFGPDVTQAFLEANQLRLILRSHEGPDARDMRTDLGPMDSGWSLDHDCPSGRLMTLFSAPDYPQFQACDEKERSHNKAAVMLLSAPGYYEPRVVQFEAVLPRPEAKPYYDFEYAGCSGPEDGDEDGEAACGLPVPEGPAQPGPAACGAEATAATAPAGPAEAAAGWGAGVPAAMKPAVGVEPVVPAVMEPGVGVEPAVPDVMKPAAKAPDADGVGELAGGWRADVAAQGCVASVGAALSAGAGGSCVAPAAVRGAATGAEGSADAGRCGTAAAGFEEACEKGEGADAAPCPSDGEPCVKGEGADAAPCPSDGEAGEALGATAAKVDAACDAAAPGGDAGGVAQGFTAAAASGAARDAARGEGSGALGCVGDALNDAAGGGVDSVAVLQM